MKNNNEDKLVKEKIESLDTLAGGIVYGKEEAWEKLQARMEHKPVKKIRLQYWMAAAAVLLLFVSIFAVYDRSAKQGTNIVKTEKTNIPVNKTIVPEPENAPVMEPGKIAVNNSTPLVNKKHKHKESSIKKQEETIQPAITVVPPVNESKVSDKAVVANNKPVAAIVKVPMKVVHINELDNNGAAQNSIAVNNTSGSNLTGKVPVVHINEMEQEEVDIRKLLRENRMTLGRYPFPRPVYNDNYSKTEEYHQPRNRLKLMLNTQN